MKIMRIKFMPTYPIHMHKIHLYKHDVDVIKTYCGVKADKYPCTDSYTGVSENKQCKACLKWYRLANMEGFTPPTSKITIT